MFWSVKKYQPTMNLPQINNASVRNAARRPKL